MSSIAGATTGTAVWVSTGVLDGLTTGDGLVRVAMLPSAATWLAVVLMTSAAVAGIALAVCRRTDASIGDVSTCLAPLAGSLVLVAPYIPWLPDAFPVLTALAGPGRWIVWLILGSEVAWRIVATAARRLRRDGIATPRRLAILAFVIGIGASGLAAGRLTGTPLFPAGDEPHYLVIAQSLWRDGDLAIENNHARGDYREYFQRDRPLEPHYLTRGADGEIYSVHPVGLPLVLAPVYALGGYGAVRVALATIAAATGAVLVTWLLRLGLPLVGAAFAWLAVYASAPFFFFSFAVYPETLAGLTLVGAMVWTTGHAASERGSRWRWAGVGAAAGWLPWLSSKYALVAGAVILVALGRLWWRANRATGTAGAMRHSLWLIVPFGVSLVMWLAFFMAIWGTPWPGAPYGGDPQTYPSRLPVGMPGLVFDQEYGILPNAPVYVLAAAGLAGMWKAGGVSRRLAGEIALVVIMLLGTVGAFHIWWGGSAPPGRPVVCALPLLGVPMAWLYTQGLQRSTRSLARLLLFLTVGLTTMLALAQGGLLLANDRDGTSRLFEYLSTLWSLPAMLPSLIGDEPGAALRGIAVWLVAGFGIAWLFRCRWRPGPAAVVSRAVALLGIVVALSVAVPVTRPGAVGLSPPEEKPRRTLLDRFDAGRLPTAVVYDPLRLVSPDALPPLIRFEISPPDRPMGSGDDARLLYGRRLSLPAGRYELTARLSDESPVSAAGTLALRVGRLGVPLERWNVSLSPQRPWSVDVTVDTDVGFVGLEASPDLAEARPHVVLRAAEVRDARHRPIHAQVVASLRLPTTTFYFVDHNVWLETGGFWTRGGQHARVVIAPRDSFGRPAQTGRMRVRCGPVQNQLLLATDTERRTVTLAPGENVDVSVAATHGTAMLEMTASSGFVPAEIDASSADARYLGCRIDDIEWGR